MRKKVFLGSIAIFIFFMVVILLMQFIIPGKTPIMKEVTKVYLEFNLIHTQANDNGHVKIEVLDYLNKENLVNFFNKQYEFVDVTCGCPDDDIKVIFESNATTHSFSFGVYGDGNAYYYNTKKNIIIPFEQYNELLTIISKFKEADYYDESNSNFHWLKS